jgi:hypothetical protein
MKEKIFVTGAMLLALSLGLLYSYSFELLKLLGVY